MAQHKGRAAHFLLHPELAFSPPNEAMVSALLESGRAVDLFAPGPIDQVSSYGPNVSSLSAEYGWRWLMKNVANPHWCNYDIFSCTSEDPIGIAGPLSFLHRRPLVVLADEIQSGAYRGNRSERWKELCKWGIRRAKLVIVNDSSRVPLLQEYARMETDQQVLIFPGCYRQPPSPCDIASQRKKWGIPRTALVLGASGGLNLSAGTHWMIEAMINLTDCYGVAQPINMDDFARFLLSRSQVSDRLYLERDRLPWRDAWASAAACDIGLAIYTNQAPQFQNMGVSSNRLCMYLAMGVPVIASRQPSFQFIEDYDCGVMVGSLQEFVGAVQYIQSRLLEMKRNAIRCSAKYIAAQTRYVRLASSIETLLS